MIRAAVLICATFLFECGGGLVLLGQSTITCPATIGQAKHPFDRVSIYNGKSGGEEYDLAPDEEKQVRGKITQSWILKDYRWTNIFLRCRYEGTEEVFSKDIPANIATCTFVFDLDRKGNITGGRSFACR